MQTFSRKEKREKRKGTPLGCALFLFSLLGVLLFSPNTTHADVSQPSYADTSTVALFSYTLPPFLYQNLGTGISGTFGDVVLALRNSGVSHDVHVLLKECTDSTYASCVDVDDTGTVTVSGSPSYPDLYVFSGWNYVADPSLYYRFRPLTTADFNAVYVNGSNDPDSYFNGNCERGTGNSCGIKDMYFYINGVSSSFTSATSSSITLYNAIPENGTTTSTAIVPFSVSVSMRNEAYQEICNINGAGVHSDCVPTYSLELTLIESQLSLSLAHVPDLVLDLGTTSTSTALYTVDSIGFLPVGAYQGRFIVRIADTIVDYLDTRFVVVSSSFTSAELESFFDSGVPFSLATSTPLDSTNFLSFLNVPELLKTKVPFAYVYLIGDLLISNVASSTITSTLPSSTFELTIGTSSYATVVDVDLFSTSTITYFLTPTYVSLFRGLLAAVTYIGFGIFLFHHARSKEHL